MYYDMHVHSKFSSDSEMTMAQGIESAISKNLSGLCFTDHIDIDFTGFEDWYDYDIDEYFKETARMREIYPKFDILDGIEVGIQEHVLQPTIDKVSGHPYDFVICSTHLLRREDPYDPQFWVDHTDKIATYRDFTEEIYKNIQLFPDFSVLGHIDYHTRRAPFEDPCYYYKDYADILDEIFKFLIYNGKGLEVNSKSYRDHPMDPDILKRYKELGGEIVTLGSDGHNPDAIAIKFAEHAELIKSWGFDYIAHFKKMQPVFEKIN